MKKLSFLVIIDESSEMNNALRYASRRASRVNGNVVLLATFESLDFSHWKAVENIAEEESREKAEKKLLKHESVVTSICNTKPKKYIMKGDRVMCILDFLESNRFISNFVLASSKDNAGPGPLISAFTGKYRSKLNVPLTIIPANLSEEEFDNLF